MTPADIDRVFGRGRLRMVTGDHVEVFREAALPGQRRCYTKRFLATPEGDFREWTEREWRILARLVGHGIKPVPEVVQFDRGSADRPALVQTYDAGVTVDHWATLLPLERDGALLRNVFEECAHWWALARASLVALDAIHELRLVHLDLKADNVCIPVGPVDFDPLAGARALHPRFDDITLIDFAFSLVSGERLQSALPIAAQPDYDYQSPRLLHALDAGRQGDLTPTRQLDWRCDLFSLAAMLWRYLPEVESAADRAWTRPRHANARAFVRRLIEVHDGALPLTRPHADLIAIASEPLGQPDLRRSLERGWTLAIDASAAARAAPTPVTRIALPLATPPLAAGAGATPLAPAGSVGTTPLATPAMTPPAFEHTAMHVEKSDIDRMTQARRGREQQRARRLWWAAGLATSALAGAAVLGPAWLASHDVPAAVASRPAGDVAVARVAQPQASPAPVTQAPAASPAAAIAGSSPAPRVVVATAEPGAVANAPVPAAASSAAVAPLAAAAPSQTPPPGTRARPPSATPVPRTTTVASARPGAPRPGTATHESTATPVARLPPRGAPVPTPVPTRAMAFPSRETNLALARARAARAQLAQTQATAARAPAAAIAQAPARAQPQASPPTGDNAYPWAVAGKAPARGAAATWVRTTANGAAPVPSSVSTPAPATAVPGGRSVDSGSPPPVAAAATSGAPADAIEVMPDFSARANDLMANHMPRLAQRAERLVAPVLYVAGRADDVIGDAAILDSAGALASPAVDPVWGMPLAPREAQQLTDAARSEYGRRGASAQALALAVRAFGADPLDPEVAGNLAFLLLRQRPSQPEAARRLALHALTLHGSRFPQGRVEDWATLAIASALAGRERDASNAFLVSLALAPNLERHCRAALDAFAIYGERLRVPVETMLAGVAASRRATQAPSCHGGSQ